MQQSKTMPSSLRIHEASAKRATLTSNVIWYVTLSLLVVLFFFPFFWMITSSLKDPSELYMFPPTVFPAVPQWRNYPRIFEKVPFMMWTSNTVYLVILSTIGRVLSASMAAFPFARAQFRFKNLLFLVTLGTMMLPAQVTLIPQFVLFHRLGWIDTLKPLWVPAWAGGGAFSIFLMRQFIMGIPRDMDESALIDGAGYFRIFWTLVLPLCAPALATLAVISTISQWNLFIEPLIYIRSETKLTLAVGLSFLKNQPELGGQPMEHLLMGASVLSTLPLIVLFFAAQRYFVQGIAFTGIKG